MWTSDEPHAKALFLFLDRLGHYLDAEFEGGLQVRIIVDRLNWCSASPLGPLAPLGCSEDGRVEAFTIIRKDDPSLVTLLQLLGLVDSEVWAWGRLQTRKLPEGRTVRERMLEWRNSGRPTGRVIEPSEYEALFAASPARLTDYWHRWVRWNGEGRSIVLHERPLTVP